MREAVIVEAVRTPVGKRNGGLAGEHPADLSAHVLQALAERAGIDPGRRRRRVGLCLAGGRPVEQHRPVLGPRRRLARIDPGYDDQPRVRVEPAGARLRCAGGDVRSAGRRRRRWCRGDEPCAAGFGAGVGSAVRTEGAGPVRRVLVQPGISARRSLRSGVSPGPVSTSSRCSRTSVPPLRWTAVRSTHRSSRCPPRRAWCRWTKGCGGDRPSRSWPV